MALYEISPCPSNNHLPADVIWAKLATKSASFFLSATSDHCADFMPPMPNRQRWWFSQRGLYTIIDYARINRNHISSKLGYPPPHPQTHAIRMTDITSSWRFHTRYTSPFFRDLLSHRGGSHPSSMKIYNVFSSSPWTLLHVKSASYSRWAYTDHW